jgi:hypothetical protein
MVTKAIRTKCRRIYFVFAGLRHNLDSIKSKAKILLLWVDEAEPVSSHAWTVNIPTVREEGAEIWVTRIRTARKARHISASAKSRAAKYAKPE